METQIWLSCHNKFISAENITILSVSSDDFLHAILEVAEQQMWNHSSYMYDEKKRNPWPFLWLFYLFILFLIKLRGILKITPAEMINRCIRNKWRIYMGIVIWFTILDCLENPICDGIPDMWSN